MGKQFKIVRSDRGAKYHGRYTEKGQLLGPFMRFLQEHGIITQYAMSGSPSQNDVAKIRIPTLKDMVRSVISITNLPLSLWNEALKTVTYVLNRILTKAFFKMPFELWKGWKPSLRHVHV